ATLGAVAGVLGGAAAGATANPDDSIHGEADAIVPIEGSGLRTHHAVRHSKLVRVSGAPHGLSVSHAQAFNDALLTFLRA
ncbi:alpha/beta hydrolase, partial [Stenotrophomonas sp. YIM B06876]|uniref:alpha/beta fold hydrolase n=1 Tax=Stenotrophomonas sp. YIM B06876 TaxID=3060211 RepID=UPI0027396CC0